MDWESFRKQTMKYPGGRTALAKIAGLSYQAFDKRLKRENLTVTQFEKICKALNVDPILYLDRHSSRKSLR